jgi:hypothetical protein
MGLFGLVASTLIPSRNYAREETAVGSYVFTCRGHRHIQSLKLSHFILQSVTILFAGEGCFDGGELVRCFMDSSLVCMLRPGLNVSP